MHQCLIGSLREINAFLWRTQSQPHIRIFIEWQGSSSIQTHASWDGRIAIISLNTYRVSVLIVESLDADLNSGYEASLCTLPLEACVIVAKPSLWSKIANKHAIPSLYVEFQHLRQAGSKWAATGYDLGTFKIGNRVPGATFDVLHTFCLKC